MIARLSGTLVHKGIDHVILDVQGVGYEASVSLRTLTALPGVNEAAVLEIVTHVREDAIQLFGFHNGADKAMFQRLTSVSGIGPKLALNAFNILSAEELQAAIMAADLKVLGRISGVGKKMAQRMVLELGEKVRALDLGARPGSPAPAATPAGVLADLRAALEGLGFGGRAVESAIEQLTPAAREGRELEALLREALALVRS
jgi:Holliday junction DNA helicase RuvA